MQRPGGGSRAGFIALALGLILALTSVPVEASDHGDVVIQGEMTMTAQSNEPGWLEFSLESDFSSDNEAFNSQCQNQFDVTVRLVRDRDAPELSSRLNGTLPFTGAFSQQPVNPPLQVTVFGEWDFQLTFDGCAVVVDGAPYSVTVENGSPQNRAPTVQLEMTPSNPTVDDRIRFEAKTQDPDGDTLTYEWFLDGEKQNVPTDSDLVEFTNPSEGTFTLRVVVSDEKGGQDEDSLTFTISPATVENDLVLELAPQQPTENTDVSLRATLGLRPEDGTPDFRWFLDGQDITDWSSFNCVRNVRSDEAVEVCVLSAVSMRPGVDHTVTVEVTLGNRRFDRSVTFHLRGNRPPAFGELGGLLHQPADPTADTTVFFEAFGVEDPDGDPLTYEWFIDGEQQDASSSEFDWENRFHLDGEIEIRVKVSDGKGGEVARSKTITIQAPVAEILSWGGDVEIFRKVGTRKRSTRPFLYDGDTVVLRSPGAHIEIAWYGGRVVGRAFVPEWSHANGGSFTIGRTRTLSGWPATFRGKAVGWLFDQPKGQAIDWTLKKTGTQPVKEGISKVFAILEGPLGPDSVAADLVLLNLNSELVLEHQPDGSFNVFTLEGNPELHYDEGRSSVALTDGEMSAVRNGAVSPAAPFDEDQLDPWWESLSGTPPSSIPEAPSDEPTQSVERALDVDDSGTLEDAEITQAIQYWILGQTVPGTDETISDEKIRALIQLWITGEPVSPASASPRVFGVDSLRWTSPSPLQRELVVRGRGIAAVEVRVFDLGGRLVASETGTGHRLSVSLLNQSGGRLPNGVYLYAVTARGAGGQRWHSELGKLAVLN